jgi:hypothetical protein
MPKASAPSEPTPSPDTIRAELARTQIEHRLVAKKIGLSKFEFSRLVHGRRKSPELLREAFRVIKEERAKKERRA